MTKKEKIDMAVELAKAAIKNNTVEICKKVNEKGISFRLNTVSYPKGEHQTVVDFKYLVEYFKEQLDKIYNE